MINIFDLDYTLLDTKRFEEDLAEIFGMSPEQFSYDYKKYFKEKNINFNLEKYLTILKSENKVSAGEIAELKLKFVQFFKGIDRYLFPEAEKILQQYKDRGDKLILVSFGDVGWQKQKIDNLTITGCFDQAVLEEKDKSQNDFFESLKDSGQKIRVINDNAQESFAMMKKLKELGLDCQLVLIDGPYSRNTEHHERIHKLNELIQRKEPRREKLQEFGLR